MAILKFGSFVTEGSGSLAGHTIQNSKGGLQLRTKPVPKNYPSPDQAAIRSYNKIMQQGWRDLSQSERSAWNNYAISYTIQNKYGERHILSGHSLWMKYQFAFVQANLPFKLSPAAAALGPFGPELVLNGSFTTSQYWTIVASWSIAGGTANYLATAVNRMYTFLSLVSGRTYRVSFDISSLTPPCKLAILRLGGVGVWAAPYNTYVFYENGSFSNDLLCTANADRIELWSNSFVKRFSLDNLSIKQIL